MLGFLFMFHHMYSDVPKIGRLADGVGCMGFIGFMGCTGSMFSAHVQHDLTKSHSTAKPTRRKAPAAKSASDKSPRPIPTYPKISILYRLSLSPNRSYVRTVITSIIVQYLDVPRPCNHLPPCSHLRILPAECLHQLIYSHSLHTLFSDLLPTMPLTALTFSTLSIFTFLAFILPTSLAVPSRLNVTTIAAVNGRSTLECWQISAPFVQSSQAGTSGAAIAQLGETGATSYTLLPPKFNGGLHNAPVVQYVLRSCRPRA